MIISASRRTDIPACYGEWFFRRLREEYVLVRNPMNPRQISRVSLSPEVVDGIVLWTKNPVPILGRFSELARYPYYVQFTLTSYGPEVERGLPSKNKILIPAFQKLSREIGVERVIWRYDPVFLNERYTPAYPYRYFEVLARKLEGCTKRCTVSFLDWYRKTKRNARGLAIAEIGLEQQRELLGHFVETAGRYGITVDICAEAGDFEAVGVLPAHCINGKLLEQIGNYRLKIGKDKNQRPECGCVSAIDIGAYDTCTNGCVYCYANENAGQARCNREKHDPASPLLSGQVTELDKVTERKMKSLAEGRM